MTLSVTPSFPVRALVAVVLLFLVAGCTGPTPYRPATDGYGYSDRRLEGNRFLVGFDGNSQTSREEVERNLLFRSAQITLETGNDFFVLVQRSTDADTRYVSNTTYFGPPYGPCWRHGWGPYGYGWGGGYGWGPYGWGPYGWGCGGPVMGTTTATPITRYTAQAEILVFPGRTPRGDPNAYDAREIVTNLQPFLRRAPG